MFIRDKIDTDDLSIITDGPFTFDTGILDGNEYNVTILSQPTGLLCSITNATGSIAGASITNVTVSCDIAVTPVPDAIPVPTLSTWMLFVLAVLLGFVGLSNRALYKK